MNISFKIIIQIISDILTNKINKVPLDTSIEVISAKYNIPKEDVTYIFNENKLSY